MVEHSLLLVDDEALLLQGMGEWLAAAGYRVLLAEGGTRALEIVRTERVHCTVLDWNMPDLSGIEVLRRLAGIARGLPSILLSAEPSPEREREALAAGAFTFLRKPVAPELLRAWVARAIASREALR